MRGPRQRPLPGIRDRSCPEFCPTYAESHQLADPYLRQVYEFGLLEDFDHLYRYANLYSLLEGKTRIKCTVMYGRPLRCKGKVTPLRTVGCGHVSGLLVRCA